MLTAAVMLFLGIVSVAAADAPMFNQVSPDEFDPGKTFLVQGTWLSGIGCPAGDVTAAGCPIGDQRDDHNRGLLLAKTGPTSTNASAFAVLSNVKGITLIELGYDLRKPGGDPSDPRGSHCGGGAPRFDIETTTDRYFLGCNSPPPTVTNSGNGWMRLRWGVGSQLQAYSASSGLLAPVTGTVTSISIVFDEGQDAGPDEFGLAVLDNVDVNGTLVGRGSADAN